MSNHDHNHEHNHDHDCGHEHITLTLDDGSEIECHVLGIFEVEDVEYIALLPIGEEEVFLYRYEEDEEGMELINIEDDEEFEIVAEAFYALFGDDEEEDLDDFEEDYEE